MTVPDTEREALHRMLDALLDARQSLERVDRNSLKPGTEFYEGWSKPRGQLCKDASILARRAIGPRLHDAELNLLFDFELEENARHADVLATLANALRSFLPLFMREADEVTSETEEVILRVIDDFMGIHWGDEPRFFSIYARRQGQPKRLYRLNKLRLTALDWDKYLATVGVGTRERHGRIAEAYRTDWEAIRKWASAVEDQYGFRSWPPRDPERARREYAAEPERIHNAIRRDGDTYWREKRAAGDGKET